MIKEVFDLDVQHASMQFSDSHPQRQHDFGIILKRGSKVITFTEMSDDAAMRDLRIVNKTLHIPYLIVKPDEGDIAFAISPTCKLIDAGGEFSIPGQRGPARLGGHQPRYNSWITYAINNETITSHGCHFVTAPDDHHARRLQQNKQAEQLMALMKRHAQGKRISLGSGDLNVDANWNKRSSKVDEIFNNAGAVTTTEELAGRHTHIPHSIDFIWSMDMDKRVSCTTSQKHKKPDTFTDHDQITATFRISPSRGLR